MISEFYLENFRSCLKRFPIFQTFFQVVAGNSRANCCIIQTVVLKGVLDLMLRKSFSYKYYEFLIFFPNLCKLLSKVKHMLGEQRNMTSSHSFLRQSTGRENVFMQNLVSKQFPQLFILKMKFKVRKFRNKLYCYFLNIPKCLVKR